MAQFYGMMRLGAPEAWKGLAGEDKWKPTRSAYELAFAWQGTKNGIPAGIRAIFNDSGKEELRALTLEIGFVEKPTFLDTPIGPSMTDIMGYARNSAGDPVILAVEGKATESFGLPVRSWVRGDIQEPAAEAEARPTRVRRLRYLAERLGIEADEDSTLYYQLLHRTVAGVMEAVLHGAPTAVLLVHSFAEQDSGSFEAYSEFLDALGAPSARKGDLVGPISLAGQPVKLYSLWYQDKPRAVVPSTA